MHALHLGYYVIKRHLFWHLERDPLWSEMRKKKFSLRKAFFTHCYVCYLICVIRKIFNAKYAKENEIKCKNIHYITVELESGKIFEVSFIKFESASDLLSINYYWCSILFIHHNKIYDSLLFILTEYDEIVYYP